MAARTKAAEQRDIQAAMAGGAYEAPNDLCDIGQRLWREAMAMHPGSFWKPTYLPFLRSYIDSVLACVRLDKQITDEGEILRGEKGGGAYLNPLVYVRDRERANMVRLARMLAITPDAPNETDKRSAAGASARAAAIAGVVSESQLLIPGLETQH